MAGSIKIALAQMTVGDDREANRVKGEDFIRRAAGSGAAVVAFPEISFDHFFPQHSCDPRYFDWAETVPGPTTLRMAEVAKEARIDAMINLFQMVEPGQYFDSTIFLGRDGSIRDVNQMMHICETPGFSEKYYYWPGTTDFPVVRIGDARVASCICYDRHYPEMMRIFTLRGADVIIVQTATSVEEAGGILEIEMQAAALANGVYIALVNRAGRDGEIDFAGRSFVIAPTGEIIARSEEQGDDLLVVDLDLDHIRKARQVWPLLRDRRPEIYGAVLDDLGFEE